MILLLLNKHLLLNHQIKTIMTPTFEKVYLSQTNNTWYVVLDSTILINQVEVEVSAVDAEKIISKFNLKEKYPFQWS